MFFVKSMTKLYKIDCDMYNINDCFLYLKKSKSTYSRFYSCFLKNDDAVTHIFFMISDCSIVLNT